MKQQLINFFNNVIIYLGFYSWKLNLKENSSEGYCWLNKKTIDIGLKHRYPKQLILHEIAHINTCRFCNQKHNYTFWKVFHSLVRKFLPKEQICDSQLGHMQYASKGIYKLEYQELR